MISNQLWLISTLVWGYNSLVNPYWPEVTLLIKSALLTSDDKLLRSSLFDYRIRNWVSLLASPGRDCCICQAKTHRCNIFSKLYTHRKAGDAFKDCRNWNGTKGFGITWVVFCWQWESSSTWVLTLPCDWNCSGCGFERQKQQPDLMAA